MLCLAGLTRNERDFDHVAPHLADMRLIRMDYNGRVKSGLGRTPPPMPSRQEHADALALLDHLGLSRVAILGTSRGGLVAMWLAATGQGPPDRASALNDIGPEIAPPGDLMSIKGYPGAANPAPPKNMGRGSKGPGAALWKGFDGVPHASLAGRGDGTRV